MDLFNTGKEIVNVSGYLVEKDVLRIVDRIREYDPNLDVLVLDPAKADFLDAPYVIVERCQDGQLRRVFECWELNESVMDRIYQADTYKHDVQARLDKVNEAARKAIRDQYEEERAESRDLLAHVFASPNGTYSFRNAEGELVTINDDPKVKGITRADQ